MGKQFILSRKESKKCTFLLLRMSRYADIIKTWTLNYAILYSLQCINMMEFRLKPYYHIMAIKPGLYRFLALKTLKLFMQYNPLFISTLQKHSWNLKVKTWHLLCFFLTKLYIQKMKYISISHIFSQINVFSKTWSDGNIESTFTFIVPNLSPLRIDCAPNRNINISFSAPINGVNCCYSNMSPFW